jgi:hypothetical protein
LSHPFACFKLLYSVRGFTLYNATHYHNLDYPIRLGDNRDGSKLRGPGSPGWFTANCKSNATQLTTPGPAQRDRLIKVIRLFLCVLLLYRPKPSLIHIFAFPCRPLAMCTFPKSSHVLHFISTPLCFRQFMCIHARHNATGLTCPLEQVGKMSQGFHRLRFCRLPFRKTTIGHH